jgi:tetratricopeptide (TPR) repeat protein
LEREPDSAEARLLAGQAAFLAEDYDKAISEFGAVSKEKSLPKPVRAKGLVGLGLVEYARHNVDVARILFLRAQLYDPKNASAAYHLGLIYRDTYHFYEAAMLQFKAFSVLSNPTEERTQTVVHKTIRELSDQINRISAERPGASVRNPGQAAKLIEEAQALESKSRLTLAKNKYAEAMKADPFSYPAALGYAKLLKRLGKTATDVDKALAAYRIAIDQHPEVQKNYVEAAQLAYVNKRWATAVQIMDRAVAHDARNKDFFDVLIGALIKAGNGKLAKAWGDYRAELGR